MSTTLITADGTTHVVDVDCDSTGTYFWTCSCGHAGIGRSATLTRAHDAGVEHVRWDNSYPRAEHLLVVDGTDRPFSGLSTTYLRGHCTCETWSMGMDVTTGAVGVADLHLEHAVHRTDAAVAP